MQVIQSQEDLQNESFDPCLSQLHALLILKVLFKITFVTVVKKNAKLIVGRKMRLQFHDIGVPDTFHHLAFLQLFIQIPWVIGVQRYLLHNLDLPCEGVTHLENCAKRTLTYLLDNFKVRDVLFFQ